MYYRCLTLLYFFLHCHSISAQVVLKTYLGGGISSPDVSFLKGTDNEQKERIENFYESISIPYLGIQLENKFSNNISFNIDLQSSIRGLKVPDRAGHYYKVIYLDFISSVDVNLSKSFKIGTGPYISSNIVDLTKTPPIANGLGRKDWDYGFFTSMTIVINKFSFRLSYLHGLYKAFIGLPNSYRHRTFQLGIGYTLISKRSERARRKDY